MWTSCISRLRWRNSRTSPFARLGRGKHMVLGKPMAMTVPQADAMVAAVRDAGVTCVAFQGLMRLQAAALKARLDRGEIGDIVVMHQASRWSIAEDWPSSGRAGWFVDPHRCPAAH